MSTIGIKKHRIRLSKPESNLFQFPYSLCSTFSYPGCQSQKYCGILQLWQVLGSIRYKSDEEAKVFWRATNSLIDRSHTMDMDALEKACPGYVPPVHLVKQATLAALMSPSLRYRIPRSHSSSGLVRGRQIIFIPKRQGATEEPEPSKYERVVKFLNDSKIETSGTITNVMLEVGGFAQTAEELSRKLGVLSQDILEMVRTHPDCLRMLNGVVFLADEASRAYWDLEKNG